MDTTSTSAGPAPVSKIAAEPIGTDVRVNPIDPSGVDPHHRPTSWGYVSALSLSALGVVFGDIGTSPLYALRECFHGEHVVPPTPANVLGVLSLVFCAMLLVIAVKYLVFVLEADNRGEGGILALTALAAPIRVVGPQERWWLIVLGIFGAALFYGDGMITPAISVLSAVEGLNVATPIFQPYVTLITVIILVGLFLIQSHGTAGIGKLFGPVMLLWFATISLLGIRGLMTYPEVLECFNPVHGVQFFVENGWRGFLVLGSVFLVVTGGEALYADMGHFGRWPIRFSWFFVAMPALMLNYLGQGALLITTPEAASNPFYQLAPGWALYPLVILSTVATVIASQALISGAFSVTMQAAQLGFLPRQRIQHTSSMEFGQIYMPALNWALMIGCILVVLGFRTSSNLAAAYGIAVTSTMAITTVIFFIVAQERWQWPVWKAALLSGFFLIFDLAFLGANMLKIPDGGWFPLVVGVAIFVVMTTWKRGRRILVERLIEKAYPLKQFFDDIQKKPPVRVPGTAIFMSGSGDGVPPALLQNLRHNKVLHERILLMTVRTQLRPHVSEAERIEIQSLGQGFYRILLSYGFMEEPDVPAALNRTSQTELKFDLQKVSYFLGRETLLASARSGGMALWRERLFAMMSRNATSPTAFFNLPSEQVVELGSQVEI